MELLDFLGQGNGVLEQVHGRRLSYASLGRSSTGVLSQVALAQKRHLPVIGTAPSEGNDAPTRSAVHWVVLGAVLVVILSMPLLLLGMWLSGPLAKFAEWAVQLLVGNLRVAKGWAQVATVLPLIAAFALASFTGCYLGVRYGNLRSGYGAPLVGVLGGSLLASVAGLAQGRLAPLPLWAAVYSVLMMTGGLSGLVADRFARHTSQARMKGVSASVPTPSHETTKPHEPH